MHQPLGLLVARKRDAALPRDALKSEIVPHRGQWLHDARLAVHHAHLGAKPEDAIAPAQDERRKRLAFEDEDALGILARSIHQALRLLRDGLVARLREADDVLGV